MLVRRTRGIASLQLEIPPERGQTYRCELLVLLGAAPQMTIGAHLLLPESLLALEPWKTRELALQRKGTACHLPWILLV